MLLNSNKGKKNQKEINFKPEDHRLESETNY